MKKLKRTFRKKKVNVINEVTKEWRAYHKKLTGSENVGFDEHGNLFGTIAKENPMFQSEILYLMFSNGFEYGKNGYELIP